MDEWKSIEPSVWKPEKNGDQIIGVLMSKEPKDEIAGISARYYLENEEGRFLIWGTAVIDDRMHYVNEGDKVRITYEGKTTNKRNQEVNLYNMEVAKNPQKDNNEPVPEETIEEV